MMTSEYSSDFPGRVFLKHKSKMTSDCCVLKFLRRSICGRKTSDAFSESNSVSFSNSSGVVGTVPWRSSSRRLKENE